MISINIFLIGAAGSGKDTVAQILESKYDFDIVALADPIRKEFQRFYPGEKARLHREKLIAIGQTYKTIYGEDVWCRLVEERVKELRNTGLYPSWNWQFVISDGRYQVEYDYFVKERGWTPVRIIATLEQRMERLLERDGTTQSDALAKESHELDEVPVAYTIDNTGTLEELEAEVKKMMEVLAK